MRGQLTAEFMAMLATILFVFLVFIGIFFDQQQQLIGAEQVQEAQATLRTIQYAINSVHILGPGAQREIYTPDSIHSQPYSIVIFENSVRMNINNGELRESILTRNVTGNVTAGALVTFNNHNGTIVIS